MLVDVLFRRDFEDFLIFPDTSELLLEAAFSFSGRSRVLKFPNSPEEVSSSFSGQTTLCSYWSVPNKSRHHSSDSSITSLKSLIVPWFASLFPSLSSIIDYLSSFIIHHSSDIHPHCLGSIGLSALQVIKLMSISHGDRSVDLPSLNVEHNYPHLLSELVMKL